jgi:hypothetical protein
MAEQPFGNGRRAPSPQARVVAEPLPRGDRGVASEVEHGDIEPGRERSRHERLETEQELAARQRDGLRVVLRWHPCEDAVTVSVADDRTGDRFEIAVEHEHALDAFYHPYAYAA